MKIVLDTNVLVSGLLAPFGPGGEIVRLISAGVLTLQYDSRILLEYREVLSKPKFQFDMKNIDTILGYIKQNGQVISTGPLKKRLPDPDDEPFLEVAVAGQAECLISGNKKHFPRKSSQGIRIFSPVEFMEVYRKYTERSGREI